MNRELATAVRRFADATGDRIDAAATGGPIIASIATVTANGRPNGALVTISWRGKTYAVAGYAASYTPVVGHRVVCDYVDNQIFIAYRIIGQL